MATLPKDAPSEVNAPLGSKESAVRVVLGAIGLSSFMSLFKRNYEDPSSQMRIWEDLYTRMFFCFLASIALYKHHSLKDPRVSFFQMDEAIRWDFTFRMAAIGISYGFQVMAMAEGKSISVTLIPWIVAVLVFRAQQSQKAWKWAVAALGLAGLAFSFDSSASEV